MLQRWLICLTVFALSVTGQEKVFFGNLHSHTSYSDGSGTPAQAYKHARDIAHIDFLAVTEHNHIQAEQGASSDRRDGILIAKDHSLYSGSADSSIISAAKACNEDGKFVAIYGQEFSSISSGNHVNVFEIPDVITVPNGAYDQLLAYLDSVKDSRGQRPILQFNHPGENEKNPAKDYGEDDFATQSEWIEPAHVNLISHDELVDGDGSRWHSRNRELRRSFWVEASRRHDSGRPETGDHRCCTIVMCSRRLLQ